MSFTEGPLHERSDVVVQEPAATVVDVPATGSRSVRRPGRRPGRRSRHPLLLARFALPTRRVSLLIRSSPASPAWSSSSPASSPSSAVASTVRCPRQLCRLSASLTRPCSA